VTADTAAKAVRCIAFHTIVDDAGRAQFEEYPSPLSVSMVADKKVVHYERKGTLDEDGPTYLSLIFNKAISDYQGRSISSQAADCSTIIGLVIDYLVITYLWTT
jgi:hypothetical protein